uniref:WIYLD domain-containing protein n=1 Tax=Oryza glaberrima TaxID=4538 RepID=I1QLY5_ORYGL
MVRPGRGQRRIDAAIDHLSEYGFSRPIIRQTINELLADTLYGRNGWVFLEEGSYRIVVDRLLEKQANQQEQQEEDLQRVWVTHGSLHPTTLSKYKVQARNNPQPRLEVTRQRMDLDGGKRRRRGLYQQWADTGMGQLGLEPHAWLHDPHYNFEKYHHEGGTTAMEPLPENGVQTSQAEVPAAASEPAKVVAAVADEMPDSTTSVPLPITAARHTASTRRPCYGWLIESESEDDELDNGVSAVEQSNPPSATNHKMSNGWSYVEQARPSVAMRHEMEPDTHHRGMLSKRRRPSGWDVRPSY